MPTYEYACTSCGKHTEVVQSFSEEPLTECPLCGGQLRKVFGSIGIVLKGSGFYKTDSRSSGTASAPKSGATGDGSAKEAAASSSGSSNGSAGSEKSTSGDKATPSTSTPASSSATTAAVS
jgi:putative FmdB family regulatory protein